jgi:hypothetical protein
MNKGIRYFFLLVIITTYQLYPLKLDRVILATDANPNYIEFWPIVAKAWKEIIGLQPTLALIAPSEVQIDETLGDVIRFEPIEGIPTSFYAQCIRLLLPFLFPNDGCIVSDIDLIPLNKNYFISRSIFIDDSCFILYRDNAMFEKLYKQIPMCYVAGKGKIFSEIFQVYTKEHLIEKIKEWHSMNIGWFTDQELLYKSVLTWQGYPDRCIRLGKIDKITPKTRIDKFNWHYDVNLLKSDHYIDCHSKRPYSTYKNFLDEMVDHLLQQNNCGI